MMTPRRRSSGCGACIPELTTRRHRGRSQAPWTNIGVPSKLHVAHTHSRTATELFTYEVLMYSSLYLFEYCCFHLNSVTVHPDIVHRNRKRALLTQSTVREEFVEKSAR